MVAPRANSNQILAELGNILVEFQIQKNRAAASQAGKHSDAAAVSSSTEANGQQEHTTK